MHCVMHINYDVFRPECDIPRILGKVLVAATSDIPILQSVLTLSAKSGSSRSLIVHP